MAYISCKLLKIFCNSKSAVGILSLIWKAISYKDVVSGIKRNEHPQCYTILKAILTQTNWAPSHSAIADIADNEIADHQAKEAAKKSETFTGDKKFTSIADVKNNYMEGSGSATIK